MLTTHFSVYFEEGNNMNMHTEASNPYLVYCVEIKLNRNQVPSPHISKDPETKIRKTKRLKQPD